MSFRSISIAALLGAGLWLAPASVATPGNVIAIPPPGQGQQDDSVGPDALRDFSLDPADRTRQRQQPAPQPQQAAPQPRPQATPPAARPTSPPSTSPSAPINLPPVPVTDTGPDPEPRRDIVLPPLEGPAATPTTQAPAERRQVETGDYDPDALGRDGTSAFPIWLLAVLLPLLSLGAFVMIRRRYKKRAVVGPSVDNGAQTARTPASPKPAPIPAAAPRPAMPPPAPQPQPAPAAATGIVSSALRPDIRLEARATRAALEEDRFWVDYELAIHNAGTVAANGIRMDAAMMTAGPEQDQAIARLKDHPGLSMAPPPVPQLLPGQAITMRGRAEIRLEQTQFVQMGDRTIFMPLLVFHVRRAANAAGDNPQPAATQGFLVGRSGAEGGKLAPIRVDRGPRLYRDIVLKAV